MKLLAFLWNPGAEYHYTRHNLWFLLGDELREHRDFPQRHLDTSSNNLISKHWDIILAKPQTFMNRSGQALKTLMSWYNIALEDLVVIHDDLDLPSHTLRIKYRWSAWWHNWIKDIIQHLGSDEFTRIKIGIDRPPHPKADISSYVLQKLPQETLDSLWDLMHELRELLEHEILS